MSNIYNVINWGLLGEGKPPPVPVPTDSYLVMEYFCDNWAGGGEWPPNYSNIFFRKNLAGAFSKVTELLRNNYHIWAGGGVLNIEDIVNEAGVVFIDYWNATDMAERLNKVKRGLKPYNYNLTPNTYLDGWRQVFDYQLLNNEGNTYEVYIFYKPKDGV